MSAIWAALVVLYIQLSLVTAYYHTPCTRANQAQFQFPDCYLPPLRTDLPFGQASFLLSHDAATGYIQPNAALRPAVSTSSSSSSSTSGSSSSSSGSTATAFSWPYSKNQVGSVHRQLSDGARALDVRPLLTTNGTVVLHHGIVRIPVSLSTLIYDAVTWCRENKDELVLVLLSHFAYESSSSSTASMVSAVAQILNEYSVPYVDCTAVYGLTVAQVMNSAALPNNNNEGDDDDSGGGGGYLLVMDAHDTYGTSCAKENWVESQLVTCYPKQAASCLASSSSSNRNGNLTITDLFDSQLKPYLLASANNEPTDNANALGPPLSLYHTPFNEIQALWQVTTASALAGLTHFSSILHDNEQSQINRKVVNMVYKGEFNAISLLAVDNVARNGNALTSVLRNQCGQAYDDDRGALPCGTALPPPPIDFAHWTTAKSLFVVMALYLVWLGYSVAWHQRPKFLFAAWTQWRQSANCGEDDRQIIQNPIKEPVDGSKRELLIS
jgi:hypothetical protein